MKSIEEFKTFYYEKLLPELQALENSRKEALGKVYTICGPLALVVIVLTLSTLQIDRLPFVVLFVGFAGIGLLFKFLTRQFVSEFKSGIIEKIVAFIDPGLHYHKDSYLSVNDFQHSTIFLKRPDSYRGDDRVTGKVGATDIDFSEIHAQYVTRDSKGNRHYHTIFKGLFFKGDFNKNFHGQTLVLPDTAERTFGSFGQMLQSWNHMRPPLVKLEDPEFEKLFVVHSTDQVEARYILSPSLMRRIIDFQKKTDRKIFFSFINSSVFIAISYLRNLMEPRIFSTLLEYGPIQQYFEDLNLFIGIVEDLNLNTRIWTKE